MLGFCETASVAVSQAPSKSSGGMGGSALAANVLVGVGLGWVTQHYFPQTDPWGYVAGILLGFASGLWQVLKHEAGPATVKEKGSSKERDA